MRITEHLYQLSGTCYGTNSSTYVLDAGEELVLFDAGFTPYQLEVMARNRKRWGLDDKPITHVFLTHAHMDHAGNAWLFQEKGARILIGRGDEAALAKGGLVTLDVLFGRPFICCEPDAVIEDGETWRFGDAVVTAVALPGHTAGSMGFLVQVDEVRAMVTGDFLSLSLAAPDESSQEFLFSAMIRPGFLEEEYGESLRKVADMDVDILLPGHLVTYEGNVRRILMAAWHKYQAEPHDIMDLAERSYK